MFLARYRLKNFQPAEMIRNSMSQAPIGAKFRCVTTELGPIGYNKCAKKEKKRWIGIDGINTGGWALKAEEGAFPDEKENVRKIVHVRFSGH
jgi:hypothetical protein